MKILHIIDRMSTGGAQSLVVEIAKVQKEKGLNVDVMELFPSTDQTFPKALDSLGIKHFYLSTGSMYNPLHIFRIMPYLKKYDIVHVHLFPALYWAGFAKLISRCKTPMIYTEHNTNNRRRNSFILRQVDNYVYSHCYEEVVACADRVYEIFKDYFPKVKSSSIPNGVDIGKYAKATPYRKSELVRGMREDSFVVTMVARYTYPKRQDTIVEAISKLPNTFHAILVGSKPTDIEAVELRKLCEKLGVSDRVHSLYIRKDVPEILKTSDVIIMSSNYEGLSLSSIEGMASGHPFVATNVNGLREVVEGAGVLFELGNSEELALILKKLYNDKCFYNDIAKKCVERAENYDISNVVNKYLSVYKRYLKK